MNSEMSLTSAISLLAAAPNGAGAAPVSRNHESQHAHSPTTCARIRMQRILVPLDGSKLAEQALPYAAAVSKANLPHVTLLRVLELGRGAVPDAFEWEIARREGLAYLAGVQSALKALGVSADSEVLQGRAAEQIMHTAVTRQIDLIVMTSHGEGGVGQWALSSTVQKIVSGGTTSVLLVPTRDGAVHDLPEFRLHKVLAALDCSQRAECILPTATGLARAHNAELILAHAVTEPEVPRPLSPSSRDLSLVRELTERNHREATRYLEELQRHLASTVPLIQVRTMVSAHSAMALRDLAAQEGADLVLLAAHGISGDAATPYGTVATRLLQEASVPTMVVQDLESPHALPVEQAPTRLQE